MRTDKAFLPLFQFRLIFLREAPSPVLKDFLAVCLPVRQLHPHLFGDMRERQAAALRITFD
jgi:hypothetical protein